MRTVHSLVSTGVGLKVKGPKRTPRWVDRRVPAGSKLRVAAPVSEAIPVPDRTLSGSRKSDPEAPGSKGFGFSQPDTGNLRIAVRAVGNVQIIDRGRILAGDPLRRNHPFMKRHVRQLR